VESSSAGEAFSLEGTGAVKAHKGATGCAGAVKAERTASRSLRYHNDYQLEKKDVLAYL